MRTVDGHLGDTEGAILEMKDEVGMSKTIDVILSQGVLKTGDRIVFATSDGPATTRIKGLKRPRGMAEMRDAGDRWSVDHVEAACGVKIVAQGLERALAEPPFAWPKTRGLEAAIAACHEECRVDIDLQEEGVVIKADTIGGLKLAFELGQLDIPIRMATVGPVNKQDILTAESAKTRSTASSRVSRSPNREWQIA